VRESARVCLCVCVCARACVCVCARARARVSMCLERVFEITCVLMYVMLRVCADNSFDPMRLCHPWRWGGRGLTQSSNFATTQHPSAQI